MSANSERAERIDFIALVRRMPEGKLAAIAWRSAYEPTSLTLHERKIMEAYALLGEARA